MKGKPASIVAAIRGGKGVEAWLWSGGYAAPRANAAHPDAGL
jgi:hypothetical protein